MADSQKPYFDVIVVGAGNAALCAALAAREQGASVVALEKAPPSEQGGNCPFTGGGFRFVHDGIDEVRSLLPDVTDDEVGRIQMAAYTAEDFRNHLTTVTHGDTRADLMDTLIAQSRPTIDWMTAQGVRWDIYSRIRGEVGAPSVIPNSVGLTAWESGPGLIDMLTTAARRVGITVLYETEMLSLTQDESGAAVGVVARDKNETYDIDSKGVILACGGGVTTDLVGYAAASTRRGIRWAAVRTTLLGMVDAAIGGKTGINHDSGKNLIGAFWQPSFVICNTQHLQTLPEREMIAGLGEVIKYGGLIGDNFISEIENFLDKGDLYNTKVLEKLIKISVKYKGSIVSQDEREKNIRMFLNLVHTFGHAIEKTLGYGKLLHGEAIIIGLLAAVILSRRVNKTAAKALAGYESLLKKCLRLLPYFLIKPAETVKNIQIDKKRSGQKLRFVLLKSPGKPFIASGLKPKLIIDSVKECLALYKAEGR